MTVRFTRVLSLYTFFSVFLPGLAFVIGLFPLFPLLEVVYPSLFTLPNSGFGNFLRNFIYVGTLIVFVTLGLFAGFVIHVLAAGTEEQLGDFEFNIIENMSATIGCPHREMFARSLCGETKFVDDRLVSQFIETTADTFSYLDWTDPRTEVEGPPAADGGDHRPAISTATAKSLYTLVRGYIHMDQSGRSRTFQAVFASCRSMFIVVPLVASAYGLFALALVVPPEWYSFLLADPVATRRTVRTITAFKIFVPAVLVGFLGTLAFARVAYRLKCHYVEYLIGDFLLLQSEDLANERSRYPPGDSWR